jgi:PAS domain S-box-containing protein
MNHLMQASYTTALVGIDAHGYITMFNSGAVHLLGYQPEDVLGQPFYELLEPEELFQATGTSDGEAAYAALIAEIHGDGESRSRDLTWVGLGGQRHVVSMTLSIAQDAFASQVGYLCVGRDVTEQREGQEMLVQALEKERTAVERLRGLDEAKNEFVSTVSHELRTPVTSIMGYTEILIDGSIVEPHPDQLPLLDTITRNSRRLIAVCNDLLLLSGLDSGNIQWQHEAIDLTSTLRPVEDSIRPLLSGKQLDLTVEGPDTPVVVTGDRAHLERVMINLLSNAVKFTPDGGTIRCRLVTEGQEAVLTVSDTGLGIPEEEQADLFQKFFRSSTAHHHAIQGTGLGLSIVAAIVAAHGGTISVQSAHLQGATFTVRLPLSTANLAPAAAAELVAAVRARG